MTTQYTRGPWFVCRAAEYVEDGEVKALYDYKDFSLGAITSIRTADDACVASSHDLFEFRPDVARLIAAAPELLEALELMVREYASAIPEHTHSADAAIDAALIAIKKAKGE